MSRSKISTPTKSVVSDDGAILFPVIEGEQLQLQFGLGWLTNLAGYNIHAKIVEAVNDGDGTIPTDIKAGGVRRMLTIGNGYIRNVNDGDNKFVLVIPYDVVAGFSPKPSPGRPVYAFIDVEVGEPGTGDPDDPVGDPALPGQQVWKPIRGLLAISYSPTETI